MPSPPRTLAVNRLLNTLPHLGIPVRLVSVLKAGTCSTTTDQVEFGSLGSTTSSDFTVIWLGAGTGSAARYYALAVHPVTGLVLTDPQLSFTAKKPTGAL